MPSDCTLSENSCFNYCAGHAIHPIQARLLGERPEHWRDGIVTSVDRENATIAYLRIAATATIWHHRPLAGLLQVGEPVSLHENLHVLQVGNRFVCVEVIRGAGNVAEGELGAARRLPQVVVADLSHGTGHAG